MKNCYEKRRGINNRERIYREMLFPLHPGDLLPKHIEVGCLLGIDPAGAGRQLRKALSNYGYVAERMGHGRCILVKVPFTYDWKKNSDAATRSTHAT